MVMIIADNIKCICDLFNLAIDNKILKCLSEKVFRQAFQLPINICCHTVRPR